MLRKADAEDGATVEAVVEAPAYKPSHEVLRAKSSKCCRAPIDR